MPENKTSSTNTNENIEKRLKNLEKDLKDVKKITIANLYGRYDEDNAGEVEASLKYGVIASRQNFLKEYMHLVLMLFMILIAVFSFLTFAAVTGKGLDMLEKIGIKISPIALSANNAPATPEGPKIVTTNIDDDAILGDVNAPVTIVEFSDYDCPWCRTFHQTILPELKKEFIDTGKVRFVYRDMPIKQLHPLAMEKSLAANCARDQGGDQSYYNYHDEIFARTTAKEDTLVKDELKQIAADLGYNTGQFNECLDTAKYNNEVNTDMADAIKIEAFGTPSFVVGASNSDGSVEGELIEGAMPYAQFRLIIEGILNK